MISPLDMPLKSGNSLRWIYFQTSTDSPALFNCPDIFECPNTKGNLSFTFLFFWLSILFILRKMKMPSCNMNFLPVLKFRWIGRRGFFISAFLLFVFIISLFTDLRVESVSELVIKMPSLRTDCHIQLTELLWVRCCSLLSLRASSFPEQRKNDTASSLFFYFLF